MYGPGINKHVWYYGKSLIKLNKIKHDLVFLKNCKKENLILTFVGFHVSRTHRIYERAIYQCYQQIRRDEMKWKKRQLTQSYRLSKNLQDTIKNGINNEHYIQFENIFKIVISRKSRKWVERHRKKLNSLREKHCPRQHHTHISSIDPVKNYSYRKLTQKEHSALIYGLDFVHENPYFDDKDFMGNLETFFVSLLGRCTDKFDWEEKEIDEGTTYNLTPEQLQYAGKLRSISNRFMKQAAKEFRSNKNENQEAISILKELAKDKSIHKTRPDKGKGVVILNYEDYVNKMLEILNDSSTFGRLDTDPTIIKENELIKQLLRMVDRKFITESQYKQMRPCGSQCAKVYGLPKTHKTWLPLRPVVSSIDGFNDRLNKYLAKKLQPFRKNKYMIKDFYI